MKLPFKLHKKSYYKPIIAGFCSLYFFSMLLSTYLMKEQYINTFNTKAQTQVQNVADYIYSITLNNNWDGTSLDINQKGFLNYALSYAPDMYDIYQPFSMAMYDNKGNLVAQTANLTSLDVSLLEYTVRDIPVYLHFNLSYYLSEEELYRYADYFSSNCEFYSADGIYYKPIDVSGVPYLFDFYIDKETHDLAEIIVTEAQWNCKQLDDGSESYRLVSENTVWIWKKDPSSSEQTICISNNSLGGLFPYMSNGYKHWKSWNENDFLQNHPPKISTHYSSTSCVTSYTKDNLNFHLIAPVQFGGDTEENHIYTLALYSDPHPWLAAMNYMKFIYLWGFLLTGVCIVKVIQTTEKFYRQRMILEETRRDFTNAIAHELKTPLGVIRGFAENLKENTITDKRDYYLEQIIGQTEEMDHMVQEMIYVSKLDSEQLVLKKEPVNFFEVLQNQFAKLDTLVTEKNLAIRIEYNGDFIIDGDKTYLEKALWNLASNAISYNSKGGIISIICDTNQLIIENTGTLIPEEDLTHVFDMFYTGDKSRNSKEKHLGLGLYLAKKIITLHHLDIRISNIVHSNTQDRIQVIITR